MIFFRKDHSDTNIKIYTLTILMTFSIIGLLIN